MIIKLKIALEQRIGFTIDSIKACRRLEKILFERGFYVSDTTLSRIFSIAKETTVPRNETLNLLSKFLGYDNFDTFIHLKGKHDDDEELFVRKSLELKSYLLTEQYYKAIDLMQDFKEFDNDRYLYYTQDLGKAIFGKKERDPQLIAYLLDKDYSSHHFHQFFVFEDDPFGHFRWSIEEINSIGDKSEDRLIFENFYINRKRLLQGEKVKDLIKMDEKFHHHLHSRSLEMELLLNKNRKWIRETTDMLMDRLKGEKDQNALLSYTGRWCRGLIYSGLQDELKSNEDWKDHCLHVFNLSARDLEFQAAVFAFLRLVHDEKLPLGFYLNNHWENALAESQLLLSIAFGEKKAVENYKKFLNMKLPL